MKSNLKMIIGLVVLANLIACEKEALDPITENPMAVTVNFGNDISIAENAGAREIALQFNKAALQGGAIEVSIVRGMAHIATKSATFKQIDLLLVQKQRDDKFSINQLLIPRFKCNSHISSTIF